MGAEEFWRSARICLGRKFGWWRKPKSWVSLVFPVLEATFQVETAAHSSVSWGGLQASSEPRHTCERRWYDLPDCHLRWLRVMCHLEQRWTVDLLAVPKTFLDDCLLKLIRPRILRKISLPLKDGYREWQWSTTIERAHYKPEKQTYKMLYEMHTDNDLLQINICKDILIFLDCLLLKSFSDIGFLRVDEEVN